MSDRRKMLERIDRRHPGLVSDRLSSIECVNVRVAPDHTPARGHYPRRCFALDVTIDGTTGRIGDGGLVPRTRGLTGSRKERLLIPGIGLDRLADLSGAARMETHQP